MLYICIMYHEIPIKVSELLSEHTLHIEIYKGAPGRVAQLVGHLTRKSEVLDSIPGLATYFRFSFR